MRSLHVIAHARPALVSADESFTIGQQAFRAVSFGSTVELPAFSITFEQAVTCLEELPPSSPLCQISRNDHQIRQEVVSLADHDLGQMMAQRRAKVQIGKMK